MTHGRVRDGIVGVYEGTEEVLAVADHPRIADAGNTDRPDAGISRGALRVHTILTGFRRGVELTKGKGRHLNTLRFDLCQKCLGLNSIKSVIRLRVVLQDSLEQFLRHIEAAGFDRGLTSS